MAFVPTTWVDGSAPGITAAQLNRIETGIADAHSGDVDTPMYAGSISLSGDTLPAGWSKATDGSGTITVTHNLGTTGYHVVVGIVSAHDPVAVVNVISKTSTTFVFRSQFVTATSIGSGLINYPAVDFVLVVTS